MDFQGERFPPQLLQPVGQDSGTLAETVFDEDGNDMRAADYAGVVVEGVNATTGEAVAINPQSHFFSNQDVIHAADQYDASFVKLREMRLDYNLPADMVEDRSAT